MPDVQQPLPGWLFPFQLCAAGSGTSGKPSNCKLCCEGRPEQTDVIVHRTLPGISVFAEPDIGLGIGMGGDEVLSHHVLECLQGSWYRKADGKHVGAVSGSFLEVSAAWVPRITTCRIPCNISDTLVLSIDGQTFFGTISLEAQYSITWSNGDVWVKK
ncbi:unnamed protein product [Symbiodinium natans]|uniref:Uncharacterized protein n=1 Tax=Symbiodinium natans TaxID=878477 RepID=A0A812RVM8_9DINO|nr:unnamed protein product [Symbiodinium natans]